MDAENDREQYRSSLVEKYCPYVRKKILGHVTYRVTTRPDPDRDGQPRTVQELVRTKCLMEETCEDLGCHRGDDPLAV